MRITLTLALSQHGYCICIDFDIGIRIASILALAFMLAFPLGFTRIDMILDGCSH